MIDPQARRRAGEQIVMPRETVPDLALICFRIRANSEDFQGQATAGQQADHIVIGDHLKFSDVPDSAVGAPSIRVGVAMRRNSWTVLNCGKNLSCYCACCRICREHSVRVKARQTRAPFGHTLSDRIKGTRDPDKKSMTRTPWTTTKKDVCPDLPKLPCCVWMKHINQSAHKSLPKTT